MTNVTNEDLLHEIEQSIIDKEPTETLGRMIMWIAENCIKSPDYCNISYANAMILREAAINVMVASYGNFDPAHSDNPFAFLMRISKCAIKQSIKEDLK